MPLPPRCWDYRHLPRYLISCVHFYGYYSLFTLTPQESASSHKCRGQLLCLRWTSNGNPEEGISGRNYSPAAADGFREYAIPSLTAHPQSLHLSRVLLILFIFTCMLYDVCWDEVGTCHSTCVRSEVSFQDSVHHRLQESNRGSGLHSKETL